MIKKFFLILLLFYFIQHNSLFAVDPASHYVDSLKSLLEKSAEDTNKVNVLMALALNGDIYVNAPNLSLKYEWQALELEKQFGYKNRLAFIYRKIGVIYIERLNSIEKSIEYYKQSLKLYQEINDKKGMAACYNNLGNSYTKKAALSENENDYNEALKCHSKALKLYEELGDKISVAHSCMNIGELYFAQLNYNKSIEYYTKCNEMTWKYNALDNNAIRIASVGIARSYLGLGDNQKAFETISGYKKYLEAKNDQRELTNVYLFLGDLYLKTNDYDRSIESFQEALKRFEKSDLAESKEKIFLSLAQLYHLKKDDSKAFNFQLQYSTFKDSLLKAETKRNLTLMPILNESEKQEKEIEQRDIQLNKRNIQIIEIIAIALLIIVISVLFYSRYIIKQKEQFNAELFKQQQLNSSNALEAEEKERGRIAQDLHDGIGQLLSAIKINVLALNKNLPKEDEERSTQIKNITQLVDQSIKDVRTISHNLTPSVFEHSDLEKALTDFIDTVNAGGKLSVDLEIMDLPENLNKNLSITLYRVVQEAINNILKHAEATIVTIQLIGHDHELSLMIEDNGVGFDVSNKNQFSGIGLKNIYSRIIYWKGIVNIDSRPNKGTTIDIHVPIV